MVHETQGTMTEKKFLKKIDEILDIFLKTFDATKVKYNTDEVECDKKKREVKQLVHDNKDEKLSEAEILRRSLGDLLLYFRKEAGEELKEKVCRATLLDPLCFLCDHEHRRVGVQDIFSNIVIPEEKKEKNKIHHLKLLTLAQNAGAPSSPHLILLEVDAGSGKSPPQKKKK